MVETNNIDERLQDERASDWVDALMDQPEREAFERELADDPALAAELQSFEQTVQVLRRMPQPAAPDDFLQAVQSRIRRRSRGRWFGFEQARGRFPYEAAFNIVLIGILFALYLSASATGPEHLVKPSPVTESTAQPASSLSAVIPGDALVEGPVISGDSNDVWIVKIKASVLPQARAAIQAATGLELLQAVQQGDSATLHVRVSGPRGDPSP